MPLLYTYYGDDFTGSTDVLEQLGSNGIPAVLFLGAPTAAHLAAFPDVRAIGVAGDSRSRSPEWMSANLPSIFEVLKSFDAPVTHYKVCSTFDSSPALGSIGRAIEIGQRVFSSRFVPIVVGAPHLRRYVAFGNLFAADPDGIVQRIDRHPMRNHPATPMREADLRIHLAAQGCHDVALIDVPSLNSGKASAAIDSLVDAGQSTVLFDTIDALTQSAVGNFVWQRTQEQPLFAVGSSGLTAALVTTWRTMGLLADPPVSKPLPLAGSGPLLIVSGSCSETTRRQLEYAFAHGYRGIAFDPGALVESSSAFEDALGAANSTLSAGCDTVLYTALGTRTETALGDKLGVTLGNLLREILAHSMGQSNCVRRIIVCGGDTCSHAVQQLDLYALTWVANIQPGGPLCRAHANSPALNGLELVLKGGQVGTDNFFNLVRGI